MTTNLTKKRTSAPYIYAKRREQEQEKLSRSPLAVTEYCHCPSLSPLHCIQPADQDGDLAGNDRIVPASPALNQQLRSHLQDLFPRTTPLSIILLHITQVEPTFLPPRGTLSQKRYRHHGPQSFLEQVLTNIRRVIRADDHILQHESTGAALIFPNVDQQGAYSILERMYYSIGLLQAETVTPPLTRETSVLLGSGSFPEQGASVEHLLYHAGRLARTLTLRPALMPELLADDDQAVGVLAQHQFTDRDPTAVTGSYPAVPFMRLPRELPARLKQLIPPTLARELNCVPVGRDHHRLTVAMADPTNRDQVKYLGAVTGMSIFPVSCQREELDLLLEKTW